MTSHTRHNIATLLDRAASRRPDRIALVIGRQHVAFADLQRRVRQCAELLTRCGLRAGDRAILMIPMSPDLYVAMLGVMRCGAVAVFVDPWIPMRQIAAFAAFATPTAFIGIPKSHMLRLLNPRLARVRIAMTTGRTCFGIPARYALRAAAREPGIAQASPVTLDDPALITFTSGSSGIPKGANRTHGFLAAQYEALCHELDYRDDDVDMPMFPVFALRNLAAGITSVIPTMDFRNVAAVNGAAVARQIRDHAATLVTASPPFIDRLADLPTPPRPRRILTGGAPVTARQIERWHAAFPNTRIEIVYGSTEAEPVAHLTSHARLAAERPDGFCCGKPTPLLRTRIIAIRRGRVRPEELEALTLPAGQIGELLVAGRHVCRDYFNNPDAVADNKVIMPDGTCWHRMGDTGYFDAEGRFFLTGRVHTTIVYKGKMLHAQLVEATVTKALPGAVRVAALDVDGQLVVIVQGEAIPDPDRRIEADRIVFTAKPLPVDPRHNTKIDYATLRERLIRGEL